MKVLFHHLEVTTLDKDFHLRLEVLLTTSFQVADVISYLDDTFSALR